MQKHQSPPLCLLFLLLSLGTAGQSDLTIVKNNSQPVPFTQKYLQYTETREGLINFNAILTRKMEKADYRGRPVLLITQTYQTNKSINTDSSYCDPQTLLPLAYFTDIKAEKYKEEVIFHRDSISNTIYKGDSLQHFVRNATGLYNGVITDDLVSVLSLSTGNQFSLPTVNPGLHYFEYITRIVVDGKEEITLPDAKKIMCWKLRIYQGAGDSFSTQWYSVDKHRQLKTRSEFKNGNAFVRVAIL
jgi:hypothetical protein